MIHFPLLAIFVSRALAEGRELVSLRSLRVLVPVGLVAAVAAALFFLPYVRVSRAQGLSRPASEIETYSATLASYFSPSDENFYFGAGADRFLDRVFGDSADALPSPRERAVRRLPAHDLLFRRGRGERRRRLARVSERSPWTPGCGGWRCRA